MRIRGERNTVVRSSQDPWDHRQGFITRRELKVRPLMAASYDPEVHLLNSSHALRGLGFSPSKEEIAQLLARHARVAEGSLTEQEFCLVTQRLRDAEDLQKGFHQMFQLLDSEAAGFVTVADLQQVCPALQLLKLYLACTSGLLNSLVCRSPRSLNLVSRRKSLQGWYKSLTAMLTAAYPSRTS